MWRCQIKVLMDSHLRVFVPVLLHVAGRKLSNFYLMTSFYSLENIVIVVLIIQNQSSRLDSNLGDWKGLKILTLALIIFQLTLFRFLFITFYGH